MMTIKMANVTDNVEMSGMKMMRKILSSGLMILAINFCFLAGMVQTVEAAIDWSTCRTETGTFNFNTGQTQVDVNLTTNITDTSKAFLLVSETGDTASTSTQNWSTSGHILNTGTLRFERGGNVDSTYGAYTVVECFNNEFNVTRGTHTLNNGTGSANVGISVTDWTNSIVLLNFRSPDAVNNTAGAAYDSVLTRGALTSNSNLQLNRAQTGSTVNVRYEIVEFSAESNVNVQSGTINLASGNQTATATVSTADLTRSWLYFTYDATNNGLQQTAIDARMTNSTTVEARRHATGAYVNQVQYYVVTFPASTVTVQRFSDSAPTLDGCVDNSQCDYDFTLAAPVTVNKAFPFYSNTTQGTGTAMPRQRWRWYLLDANTLRAQNWRADNNNSTAYKSYQVVEFPAGGGGPTCSDGIQNQGETGIDCGGPCAACGATTVINTCEMDGDFCTFWTPSDNGTTSPWTFDADFTTSNNVGPSGPYSGTQYVYTEASTPNAGDEWYLTSPSLDADTYDLTLDFWYNKHHNGIATCDLHVDVSTNGGSTWASTAWSTSVDDGVGNANGTNWRNQQVNLSAYSGNIMLRFRAASGGNWQCDTALDLVEVSGVTAGSGGGGGGGVPLVNPAGTYIEAENYTTMSAPNPWSWEVQSLVPGYSGTGYLYTTNGGTGANPQGARADYPLDFGGGGTYCIWIRGMDQSGAGGGDSVFWGVDGNYVGAITQTADNVWAWDSDTQNGNNCFTVSAGIHTLNLWPREAGQKTDAILISTVDANADPSAGGLLTGDDDQTTVIPPGATVVDPTDTGGPGANYLIIPESQIVNGASVNLRKVDLTADPAEVVNPDELVFDTDQTVTYRALGFETDGFDDFSVQPKWQHANVGNDVPGAPVMEQMGGVLNLKGSGQDIWNTADYFSYHFQGGKSGDFTIDVEVKSLVDSAGGAINAWAKTGIMVRQSLANNSRHAMMVVTPQNGARFQYRPTDGAASQNPTAANGVTAPTWLRLKRVGNTFTGYYSNDGINWTESNAGGTTVNMTDPVNIGLAVTSHDTNRDSVATFDNFLFMPAATSGMSETWTSASTVFPWTSIDTTDWSDGTFGISMRGGGNIETKLFDYSKCTDSTPSTITIAPGQTVSGGAASLSALFTTTGNVGSFQYMIDGATVSNPWNSFAAQANGTTGPHTLTVSGTDPDCGGSLISASQTITVDNTCADATPSTITILTGQAVGGPAVDLTALHTSTGNVASFTYKINGTLIATPTAWDSSAFGGATSEDVTLEVSGTDPDCGGRTVTALNTIAVDNTCVRNEPSISFDQDVGYVGAGRAKPYQVTIRNEDSFNCSPSTFNVNITSDPVNADFVASYFNPPGSNANLLLNGRETATFELAVEATANPTEWNEKDVALTITSVEDPGGTHNDGPTPGPTTGTVTTKIFLVSPITHNSVTTGSSKWGGNWGTSEAGSKYGNFDCLTCHSKTGSEIKWMRGSISTPDGSNWAGPGSPSVPVQFKDARSSKEIVAEGGDPINDVYWGHDDPNDDGSGRTTSDRVCEICHSITQHHRYDTNADPDGGGPLGPQAIVAGTTHFPGRDCTDCHRHSLGFTADCTGCHGDPPLEATLGGPNGLADIPAPTGSVTPGTHYKHTVVLGFPCEYCHAGWRNVGEMPKEVDHGGTLYQDINHLFDVFSDLGMTDPERNNGHYTGQDGVSYEGTLIAPGAGTMTCENIYCHGGTSSMGGTNPTWNGNITCNGCHGTSATNTPPGYSHTTHVGEMGLACTDCHYTAGQQAGYNGHVNGRVNIQMNPALPSKGGAPMYDPTPGDGGVGAVVTYNSNGDGSDMPPSSQYGSCLNIACHYGNETPVWNNGGQAAQCNDCHNDGAPDDSTVALQLKTSAPNTGNHEQHVHPEMAHFGDADVAIHTRMVSTFISGCESCHGGGANTGDHAGHVNLAVDFGGGMSYSLPNGNGGTCTSQCHTLDSETGGSVVWGSPEFLDCSACHQAPYLGPTVVDPAGGGAGMAASGYGSHLKAANGDTFSASTNWTTQCKQCHPYHAGGFEVTQPSSAWNQLGDGTDMAYKLGLQFPVTGGVHLERSGVAPNSEAEMCWTCHDANSISEWGQNNNAMTGSMIYNYGSVTTSNWTSAVWTSGYGGFGYKTAAIQSTHAANQPILAVDSANGVDEVSRSGVDDVTAIRCTYCHDVHDRNKALVDHQAGTYETLTGAPYLRGAWTGNPYKEDGAPQSGTTYNNYTAENYGQVPRGSSNTAQQMGGYWIDQNSGNPVSGTYDTFGGLCQMCHGTDINTLNQYGAQGAGWVSGLNGHANSVKGGSGVGGNIFTNADRGGGATNNYNGGMGYWGFREPGDGGGGMRGGDGDSFSITPGVDGFNNEPCANDGGACNGAYESDWDNLRAFDVTGAANNSGYHTFSCSKCHNPHASRLPKLMITNCLDTKHNSWDDNVQAGTVGVTVMNNTTAAVWTTAQNCHRLAGHDDPQDGNDQNQNSQGSGWNLVTPWTDTDAYNSGAAPTQDNSGAW